MKKRYTSKANMARALVKEKGLLFKDAKSRLSRKSDPVRSESQTIEIDGEFHHITFYLTPAKWLK